VTVPLSQGGFSLTGPDPFPSPATAAWGGCWPADVTNAESGSTPEKHTPDRADQPGRTVTGYKCPEPTRCLCRMFLVAHQCATELRSRFSPLKGFSQVASPQNCWSVRPPEAWT
jgi:hypothetical protein